MSVTCTAKGWTKGAITELCCTKKCVYERGIRQRYLCWSPSISIAKRIQSPRQVSPSGLRNTLNLNDGAVTRREGLQARSRGHGLGQKVNVHLVHGGKVLHVGEVDVVLDDLVERGA